MTPVQAKEILRLYRSDKLDGQDPEIQDALALARANPELNTWLEDQQRLNQRISSVLRHLPLPAQPKVALLAHVNIIRPVFWRRREFLAAAASIAAAATGLIFWQTRSREDLTFAGFQQRMLRFAIKQYRMDIVSNNEQEVRSYLSSKGAPAQFPVPAKLAGAGVKGGARLSWQNHPVAMVCFHAPQNQTLYLFVMERAQLKGPPPPQTPGPVQQHANLSAISWSADGKVYLLAAAIPPSDLNAFTPAEG